MGQKGSHVAGVSGGTQHSNKVFDSDQPSSSKYTALSDKYNQDITGADNHMPDCTRRQPKYTAPINITESGNHYVQPLKSSYKRKPSNIKPIYSPEPIDLTFDLNLPIKTPQYYTVSLSPSGRSPKSLKSAFFPFFSSKKSPLAEDKGSTYKLGEVKVMGAFLEKPLVEKTTTCGEGPGFKYAMSAMQGWRVDMEDAHCIKVGLDNHQSLKDWSFFAVFDGHAGKTVAQYSADALIKKIIDTEHMHKYVQNLPPSTSTSHNESDAESQQIQSAIRSGFLTLDQQMRDQAAETGDANERSGSTVVSVLLTPWNIYFANLGDSRAILSKHGEQTAFATEDHKPFLPKERDRIVAAGGSVMIQRVNGSLAVSRALGDFEYKCVPGLASTQQLVSPEPDVTKIKRDKDKDEFLVLACDGIFDVMNNSDVVDFIRHRLKVTHDLGVIANQLLDACLSKTSRDNMSVIIVLFNGAPKICTDAVKIDQELQLLIRKRINHIFNTSDKPTELDVDNIMRCLLSMDGWMGLPRGTGLHAFRGTISTILDELKSSAQSDQSETSSHKSSSPPKHVDNTNNQTKHKLTGKR